MAFAKTGSDGEKEKSRGIRLLTDLGSCAMIGTAQEGGNAMKFREAAVVVGGAIAVCIGTGLFVFVILLIGR